MTVTTTYARHLVRRMLTGSGSMTLARDIPVVLHGVDAAGRLIVACRNDDADRLPDAEVRIDCMKAALEVTTNITVAGLYGPGRLSWLPAGQPVPGFALSPAPHLRFGVLDLEHVHLRWPCGATTVRINDLGDLAPSAATLDEVEARDRLGALGPHRLATLHAEALTGLIDAEVLDDRRLSLCARHRHRVWVGDVTEQGVMLIGTGVRRISVTFVRFPEPADTADRVPAAISALAGLTS
jgi:hypothetical protein